MTFEDLGDQVEWDEEFAAELMGRTLLVGLTLLDADETVVEQQQVFGTVVSCHPVEGITIELEDTEETFVIPPILEAIEPADPGIYQLTEEDEPVEDPDYTVFLTLMKPSLS